MRMSQFSFMTPEAAPWAVAWKGNSYAVLLRRPRRDHSDQLEGVAGGLTGVVVGGLLRRRGPSEGGVAQPAGVVQQVLLGLEDEPGRLGGRVVAERQREVAGLAPVGTALAPVADVVLVVTPDLVGAESQGSGVHRGVG